METLVLIEGTIVNPVQHTQEELARFSIENEEGRFYIQVRWSPQLARLQVGDAVTIVGTLHSFVFPRCRCQHVYIEPMAIVRGTTLVDDPKRSDYPTGPLMPSKYLVNKSSTS